MSPRERLARIGRAAALAALIASVTGVPAAAQVILGPGGPGSRNPLPLRGARKAVFTATEGTWMSLDVSPDGTTIVFDLLGDLYTMPIEGGEASPLLTGMAYETQPRFSPDGESVAFISDRSGGDALWTLRLDLTDTTRVAGGGSSLMLSPAWSPDGVYIVASRSNGLGGVAQLAMYHAERGSPLPLPGSAQQKRIGAAFSPDGRYVWYAGGSGDWTYNAVLPLYQLYRYDRETGTTTTMTNRYGSAFRPAISPDGRWLVYGTRYNADTGLRKRDLETGEESWLAYPVQRDEQESRAPLDLLPGYAFLPDGSAIVISYGGRIWNVPMDGSEPAEIPFEADVELDVGPRVSFEYQIDTTAMVTASQIRSPVVAPDGERVVFTAFDRLWIRDLPDGEARRLTEDDTGEFHPQWSPDGRWIAYTTWDDADGGHIMKVAAEGGEPIRLSATAALYYNVAWSPDGGRIVASRGAARQLKEAAGAFFGPIGGEFVWVPAAGPEPADAEVISPTGLRDVPHFAADDPDRIYAYSPVEGLVSFRWDGTDVKRHLIVRGRQGIAGIGDPHPNEWEFLPRRVFPWRQGPDPTDPDPPAEPGGPHAGRPHRAVSRAGDRAFVQFGRDLFVADLAEDRGARPRRSRSFRVDSTPPLPVRKVTDVGGEFAFVGARWGRAPLGAGERPVHLRPGPRRGGRRGGGGGGPRARPPAGAGGGDRRHPRGEAGRGGQPRERRRGGAGGAGGRDHAAPGRLRAGRGRLPAGACRLDPAGGGGGGREVGRGARGRRGGPRRHDGDVRGARAPDRSEAAAGHPARHGRAHGRADHHDDGGPRRGPERHHGSPGRHRGGGRRSGSA